MARYVGLDKQRLRSFAAWRLEHIPRDSNERVNTLVVVASSIPIKETIFLPIYYQSTSSITTYRVSQIDETCPSWLTPIMHYQENCQITKLKPTRSRSRRLDFPW